MKHQWKNVSKNQKVFIIHIYEDWRYNTYTKLTKKNNDIFDFYNNAEKVKYTDVYTDDVRPALHLKYTPLSIHYT